MLARADSSLLLLVDLQTRLLAAMPNADALVQRARILATAAKALEVPIHATEQYPKGLGPTHTQVLEVLGSAAPVAKDCFSACGAGAIDAALRNAQRRQIVLAGIESHICVLQTAFELRERGFDVFVVGDAVGSRQESNRQNALARMRQGGVIISNTESVLFEWLRGADHGQFKAVSALIK